MAFLVKSALIATTMAVAWSPAGDTATALDLRAVNHVDGSADVIIDTRPVALCQAASLPGAICLSPRDVLGPHDRMANVSGLLWLLGTAGLTGRETVLVAGGPTRDRDFIAGLLFLAGQKTVLVLTTPIAKAKADLTPGTTRSATREVVYQTPMRSEMVVLRSELLQTIRSETPPVILDGRSEEEYWGAKIRAARGGHVPGAQHTLAPILSHEQAGHIRQSHAAPPAQPIVYGHDARDGLAILARHVAAGRGVRVYLEGWSGWASDGALPADSVTYPDLSKPAAPARNSKAAAQPETDTRWHVAGLLLAGLGLAAGAFLMGRRSIMRAG